MGSVTHSLPSIQKSSRLLAAAFIQWHAVILTLFTADTSARLIWCILRQGIFPTLSGLIVLIWRLSLLIFPSLAHFPSNPKTKQQLE